MFKSYHNRESSRKKICVRENRRKKVFAAREDREGGEKTFSEGLQLKFNWKWKIVTEKLLHEVVGGVRMFRSAFINMHRITFFDSKLD